MILLLLLLFFVRRWHLSFYFQLYIFEKLNEFGANFIYRRLLRTEFFLFLNWIFFSLVVLLFFVVVLVFFLVGFWNFLNKVKKIKTRARKKNSLSPLFFLNINYNCSLLDSFWNIFTSFSQNFLLLLLIII